jgi:hypothetical protein
MIMECTAKYMDSNSDPADAGCVYIENEKAQKEYK